MATRWFADGAAMLREGQPMVSERLDDRPLEAGSDNSQRHNSQRNFKTRNYKFQILHWSFVVICDLRFGAFVVSCDL